MAEFLCTNTGLRLANKVAIVTGGASSIGKETAHLFAEQGARMVVIADIQDELGKQVAETIGTHRCTYIIHCNVVDEDQVKNLVQSTVDTYGQVIINKSH
jgi:NAD(P)-dependent dehydrogenase (short-subunit alcohol dehydrogenase family)